MTLAGMLWERELPVIVKFIAELASGAALIAAGYAPPILEAGPGDWDDLGGGAFLQLSSNSGTIEAVSAFDVGLGWGDGAVSLVCLFRQAHWGGPPGRSAPISLADGRRELLVPPLAEEGVSFGLAHTAVLGPVVVAGFNRGGHRVIICDCCGLRVNALLWTGLRKRV